MHILKNPKIVWPTLIAIALLVPVSLIAASFYIIEPYTKYVRSVDDVQPTKVGMVLGAGISANGRPYNELKARLDVAATALQTDKVELLILSGDNRFDNYNEPEAMKRYLMDTYDIAEDKLVPDYAGRSTYESCERAAKIFGVEQLTIFSAGSHLPRAIYLCRHFGIEAVGVASGVEANNSGRREPLARIKAVYNVHIIGEPTVLGDAIPLN